MKKIFFLSILVLFGSFIFINQIKAVTDCCLCLSMSAQEQSENSCGDCTEGQYQECAEAGQAAVNSTEISNPINENNPIIIIAKIIKSMLGVLGAVAVLVFVYGGFTLIFAAGNEEKLKKGRGVLVWAIIGLAIILSSYSLLSYVFEIIVSSTGA